MVNIEDFIKRLEIILDYYSLNASSFADKIGVQRSSLSHLLSGRNKPSLDFILKILEVFPDIDLYWILNGKGTFPKKIDGLQKNESSIENDTKLNTIELNNKNVIPENLFSEIQNSSTNLDILKTVSQNVSKKSHSEEIDKIVIFYKNGTFKSYIPE